MTYSLEKNQTTETAYEGEQRSYLSEKDFKVAIIIMFTKLKKKTMIKVLITMIHQIDNINKEINVVKQK